MLKSGRSRVGSLVVARFGSIERVATEIVRYLGAFSGRCLHKLDTLFQDHQATLHVVAENDFARTRLFCQRAELGGPSV